MITPISQVGKLRLREVFVVFVFNFVFLVTAKVAQLRSELESNLREPNSRHELMTTLPSPLSHSVPCGRYSKDPKTQAEHSRQPAVGLLTERPTITEVEEE